MTSFSLLISKGKLSKYAHAIASSGRLLARNMLASECIIRFAKLLENVLAFPSDARLPDQVSQLKVGAWEWNMFQKEIEGSTGNRIDIDLKTSYTRNSGVLFNLEEEMPGKNISEEADIIGDDVLSQLDWDILTEIENSEEFQKLESEEVKIIRRGTEIARIPFSLVFKFLFDHLFSIMLLDFSDQLNNFTFPCIIDGRKIGERIWCMG